MRNSRFVPTIIALGLLVFAGSARAIVVGQLDNFEDNTLQGWDNGNAGAPPVQNINTGGPGGAADHFMQVTSDGSGTGRFLTVFNRTQWLGDYVTPGVTAIEMDLRNLGNVGLTIRLGFKENANFGAAGYVSQGFFLAAGSGWQHVVFSINAATMTAVGDPASFNSFFQTGPGEMRIINETGTGNLNGDVVAGQLGVDNIHAVPEPGAALLSIAGLLVIAIKKRSGRVERQ